MGNRRQLTKDIGDSGLDIRWGVLRDDYLREWNMPEKAKNVDEMLRNASVIGALRFAMEMLIRSADWFFESDDGDDDERLEFAQRALGNIRGNWGEHISDALMCIFYGWMMFTITYEQVGPDLLWRKFKPLKHGTLMRWLIADDGGLAGIQQWPTDWPEPIPIERMIVYKIRSNFGSPEGESILRPAYPDYYYAKNLKALEGIAFERNGSGYPTITLPETADTSDESENSDIGKANKIVRNVRNDQSAGLVLPYGWEFEFKSTGNVLDFGEVIGRYEKRILTAALAQFLLLGQDKVGALSLSSDLSELFSLAIDTVCDTIAETFTQYPLKRLLRLNGRDPDGVRLNHTPVGDSKMQEVADFLQKVLPTINWTAQDEAWLRSVGNLPERSPEEIQADMDMKEERNVEIAARLRQAQVGQNGRQPTDDTDDDQMGAEVYNAPLDAATRQKFERDWERRWESWFDGQLDRVVEEAGA